jgi:pyruvate kinase
MSARLTRRTKIVCTIGPASRSPEFVEQLAWAGMDAARLNFSHGAREDHRAVVTAVRRAQQVIGRPLAVIADLQGPKIRIGTLAEPRAVNVGDRLVLSAVGEGSAGDIEVTFPGLASVVQPGAELLIDDGRVRVRVESAADGRVECLVELGGLISSGKGVNLPGTSLPIPSLTEKDIADLDFALGEGVDYVALSFVRRAQDVVDLRDRIATARSSARVIAKIEKAEAVADLEAIVAVSDAVMVARGDLGVEIGVADVPLVQKRIIRSARETGRTVITATQMLESMINQPEPTRAEASDVANAVLDGTSALMLSGETAVGRYPLEAVAMMNRIARAVEPSLGYQGAESLRRDGDMASILSHAACDIAEELGAPVIAVPTQSGSTARQVSRFRPGRPIVAASPYPHVLQQLALDWAVVPIVIEDADSIEDLWSRVADAIKDSGLAAAGDKVVLTGGTRLNLPGSTNHILVHTME